MRIAKADYFAGIFLTTILKSSRTTPVYCEAIEGIKRLEFETDLGVFNVYVKYSMRENMGWNYEFTPKKMKKYWNVAFSENEYAYLKDQFVAEGKENVIAIICTDSKLKRTRIVILKQTQLIPCIAVSTSGGSRILSISRTGAEHTFSCYGVGGAGEIVTDKPFVNHLRYFDNIGTEQEDECESE